MNRLISSEDVCRYLKIANTASVEPHIDTGHALVSAALLTSSLDQRAVVQEKHTLKYDSELIELRDGPIVEVTAITVNGTAMDLDDVIIGWWTIQYPDGWSRGDVIKVDYLVGWGDISGGSLTPPDGIVQALIQAAAQVFNTPSSDLVYEKIGDYTKQTAQGVPGSKDHTALEPRTLLLLQPYKRPSAFC
jgi:hypothetical protein